MATVTYKLLIILILLLANGFLALSEIAVVSARRSRLLQRAEHGDLAAAAAADLSLSPTRFLSTVQVGITLIGILSGVYGGATIAQALAAWFTQYESVAAYSEQIGVGIVVVALSFSRSSLASSCQSESHSAILSDSRRSSRDLCEVSHGSPVQRYSRSNSRRILL